MVKLLAFRNLQPPQDEVPGELWHHVLCSSYYR